MERLSITRALISHFPSSAHDLLLSGKQCFLYEFVTYFDKLKCSRLPAIEHFYSTLKKCGVRESNYNHAQAVWTALNCQTLKDYMLAYLTVDLGLLADIVENWRHVLHEIYGLEITHYVSFPGYAFHSFLKSTEVKIITNIVWVMHSTCTIKNIITHYFQT